MELGIYRHIDTTNAIDRERQKGEHRNMYREAQTELQRDTRIYT